VTEAAIVTEEATEDKQQEEELKAAAANNNNGGLLDDGCCENEAADCELLPPHKPAAAGSQNSQGINSVFEGKRNRSNDPRELERELTIEDKNATESQTVKKREQKLDGKNS